MADARQPKKPLGQLTLTTSAQTLYTPSTATPNATGQVNTLWFTNRDSADHYITMRWGSGTLDADNGLMETTLIKAGKTYVLSDSEGLVSLLSGQKLEVLADANDVITATAFGVEFTS